MQLTFSKACALHQYPVDLLSICDAPAHHLRRDVLLLSHRHYEDRAS